MKLMKKLLTVLFMLVALACSPPWEHPRLDAEDYPMKVGAVHVYRLEGHPQGDSLVVTTVGTEIYDHRTIYIDSTAYFKKDTFQFSREEYSSLTEYYLYYYGNSAVGYLKEPIRRIDFPLYEGKTWLDDPSDTLSPEWECVDYDTLWLESGRYRTFCVQPPSSGSITSYWYAPGVGLVKLGQSDLAGTSWTQELLAYYPEGDTTGAE